MLSQIITTSNKLINRFILIILCLTPSIIHTETNKETSSINSDAIYQSCYCDFCDEIRQTSSIKTHKAKIQPHKTKSRPKAQKPNKTRERTWKERIDTQTQMKAQ